ncbi:MFS transporter [Roseovarius salis]|uniref:MFS transporter n=1 Tax=Roseovarius salis TaxID=3376063 RepID=UPI0037CC8751
MHRLWKLSAAGFAATAITYGPARMGFGLFLSEFRSEFPMSNGIAGLISSLGFFGMLLGLVAAYAALALIGPRLPVVLGLGLAALGMGLVVSAPNLMVLSVGVFLAMTSAGFAWSPFNTIVNRQIPRAARPAALSIVSTGTSLGIAAAGATALALGLGEFSWRAAWTAFTLAGAAALTANLLALRDLPRQMGPSPHQPWGILLHGSALPLYGIALSFGVTTAIYISFAADRIEQAGGLPGLPDGASSAVIFVCFGVCGLVGLATARVEAMIGLAGLLCMLLITSALSLILVALAPGSWTGVVLSAGLQGAFVMKMSAVLSFWSERLFPLLPSRSFTAALIAVAAGSVLGPVAAGVMSDRFGAVPMFLCVAAVSVATLLILVPRRDDAFPGRT